MWQKSAPNDTDVKYANDDDDADDDDGKMRTVSFGRPR